MTQKFSFQRILIVVKSNHEKAARLAQELSAWLEARQCTAMICASGCLPAQYRDTRPHLAVVLGGDGTLLGVARAFCTTPLPLLGLNFGKVGFLAELHASAWQEGLSAVLAGECELLQRMCLGWRVLRNGQCVHSGHAVNDTVISRGTLSRVISLDVSADNSPICRVRADGLIISSPLGVSGYAVSAGGPLVHPDMDALTMTPICPYLCNFPPMVLPCPMVLRVQVQRESVDCYLTVDGQEGLALQGGDVMEVFGVPKAVHFVRLEADVYFKRLKGRGFIEEHSKN